MESLKKQEESLNTTDNRDFSNSYEFENIEKSPFTIVKHENVYYGVIGNHRLTESYENKEELKEELVKITWDRLLQVIWAVNEKFSEQKETIKKILKDE
jgi:hypothetical protein